MSRFANVRVLGVVAIAVVAAVAVYPGLLRYWPLLIFAACPLSMLLMGHGSHSGHTDRTQVTANGSGAYTCPMHPDVVREAPGRCSRCGMQLVKTGTSIVAGGIGEKDEIAHLADEMDMLNRRQAMLTEKIERLRQAGESRASSRALREAEETARSASDRAGPKAGQA